MTIREAAEVLYDEYTGTKGRLGNSTQEARWIAFTEKVVRVAGQGVIDREAVARASFDSQPRAIQVTWEEAPDVLRERHLLAADAVLAVLPGRTVAQVKAEALREAAATADSQGHGWSGMAAHALFGLAETINTRADWLEREDKR